MTLINKPALFIFLLAATGIRAYPQSDTTKRRPVIKTELDIKVDFLKNKLLYEQDKASPALQQQSDWNKLRKQEHAEPLKMTQEEEKAISTRDVQLQMIQKTATVVVVDHVVVGISDNDQEPLRRKKDMLQGPTQFDSRIEIAELNPLVPAQLDVLKNSRSVGMIIRKEDLLQVTDSVYQLNNSLTLKEKYHLCTGEAFESEPVAGDGTAFLVSNHEVLTASHVISAGIEKYALIFGFQLINKQGAYVLFIPKRDIYQFSGVSYRSETEDIIRIKLNRITDRPALKVNKLKIITPGRPIYMLGYPAGLPLKAAMNASILSLDNQNSFYTSLDAFQGNSGSPVFDLQTNEVIGILVSGANDFVWNGGCNISALCRIPYCKGEKARTIPVTLH